MHGSTVPSGRGCAAVIWRQSKSETERVTSIGYIRYSTARYAQIVRSSAWARRFERPSLISALSGSRVRHARVAQSAKA